jgi:hypothetical protein
MMEIPPPPATPIVHRVGIARFVKQDGGPAVNTARCRLCGEVLERNEGPLLIGIPGLYAVTGAYTEAVKIWRVTEPLPHGMKMCMSSRPTA